jgi:hypothetical protein
VFGKDERTMVRMTCHQALTASEEIEESRWVSSDCPHELLTVMGVMILENLKQKEVD